MTSNRSTFLQFRAAHTGFALVEMAAVIAIMGILASFALFSYSRQIRNGQDRQVQQSLRAAAGDARSLTVANQGFFPATDPASWGLVPYSTGLGSSTSPSFISVAVRSTNATAVLYASLSESGTCWVLLDDLLNGQSFAAVQVAACNASTLPLPTASSFAVASF